MLVKHKISGRMLNEPNAARLKVLLALGYEEFKPENQKPEKENEKQREGKVDNQDIDADKKIDGTKGLDTTDAKASPAKEKAVKKPKK